MQWEVVWEWAVKNHVRGESWQEVAEKLDLQIKAGQWPKATLGELDSEVYNGNPERLGKNLKKRAETDHRDVRRSRQLVSAALQHVGQVYCDVDRLAPDMLMFDFFKPRQNRIINAGAAIAQSKASAQVKVLRNALPRLGANGERTPVPDADPQTIAERSRSTSSSVASQLMVRGGEGTGAARGGALSPVQRAGLVELRVDCGVSISAIPKVLTTSFVILSGTVPTEKQTVSHAHIKDLVLNEHAVDFFLQVEDMLRCLRKHRHLKVHLYHDATTHSDPRAGKYGHLTLYYLSYFDPDKNCAVKFILSCRFTAGGSSLVVARAACVLLSDVRLCTVSRCATNVIAAKLTPEFGNVIGSVVSDNTDSALNVIKDMGGFLNLSSDFSLEYPCATHINALFGKTPIAKVTGAGGGEGVPSFDRDVPANICSKLHYVYNKHETFLNSVWLAEGKPGGKFPPKPPDSLDGKWETVCLGGEYNMKYRAAWLRIAHRGAHLCIGDSSKASLKKDLDLIVKWLSHPGYWFNFLIMYGWHKRVINPNFYWLKATDAIYAQSGPGFRRQSMPRFALEQIRIANALPLTADAKKSGAVEKKCRDIFSEACGPIGLVNNGGRTVDPHRLAPAWAFEVLSAVKQVLLARLPVFGDQARAVCEKHWYKYLRPPWIFFLVTDEAQQHEQREEEENRSPRDWLGPYFARLIVKMCLPEQSCPAADASTFEDEDSKEEVPGRPPALPPSPPRPTARDSTPKPPPPSSITHFRRPDRTGAHPRGPRQAAPGRDQDRVPRARARRQRGKEGRLDKALRREAEDQLGGPCRPPCAPPVLPGLRVWRLDRQPEDRGDLLSLHSPHSRAAGGGPQRGGDVPLRGARAGARRAPPRPHGLQVGAARARLGRRDGRRLHHQAARASRPIG